MTSALSPRARSEYAATVVSGSLGRRHGRIARALGTVHHATARLRGRHLSVGQLAVIRRSDGAFVVDIDAGSRDHADELLHLVRDQLATMSVTQFEDAWGIDRHVDVVVKRHLPGTTRLPQTQGRHALRSAG